MFALTAMAQNVNPVIPGFHPDPSVCRVGDKFYLVNSSFQYFPGVPIFESTDMQHWTQIGNVLDRQSQLPLKGATSWQGIYAPTIRYNDGVYYMITTNVGNGGNFMVTASDPRGPWSEPMWLEQQGIDPSLYFENDVCYMVSNPDNTIMICEIDPRTGGQLTESKPIWRGTGGRYPEGPHIYKKDGYYYLMVAEGGTMYNHGIRLARSKNIYGPYEYDPMPLLTTRDDPESPLQRTGHGSLVETQNGDFYVTYLCGRPTGEKKRCILGRETALAEVVWDENGWLRLKDGGVVPPAQYSSDLPEHKFSEKPECDYLRTNCPFTIRH